MLHELTGRKWVDADLELEAAAGSFPTSTASGTSVHAMQWAAGLELLLLSEDPVAPRALDRPSRTAARSCPTRGSIRLLMDRAFRDEQIARLKPEAPRGHALADGLAREYSLSEIAIVTRAAPGAAARPRPQGPPRTRSRRRRGDLRAGRRRRDDVHDAAPRAEGRRARRRGRPAARARPHGRTLARRPRHDPRVERAHPRRCSKTRAACRFEDYVVARGRGGSPWS